MNEFQGHHYATPALRDRALLDHFATWLEQHGYLDTDWWAEEPKAIDRYMSGEK